MDPHDTIIDICWLSPARTKSFLDISSIKEATEAFSAVKLWPSYQEGVEMNEFVGPAFSIVQHTFVLSATTM